MARTKTEEDHGLRALCLLLYSLAAFCLSFGNAEVYNVVLDRDAEVTMMGIEVDVMDVSTRHNTFLQSTLGVVGSYTKVHDFSEVLDGFTIQMTPEQAYRLSNSPGVLSVQEDSLMHVSTTHTYEYMALPGGAWNKSGGTNNAGEDVVIGIIDTGIYPDHPSFADDPLKPYGPLPTYKGVCRNDSRVPNGFCNGKIVGAQYFFAGAVLAGVGNATDPDMNSPLDAAGHGSHCAGTSAGNFGVEVVVNGVNYGIASGTAPRARIAVYKALNAQGSGATSDIIKAIDQAILDGVDILSLSLGPSAAPTGNVTYTDSFEVACLGAVRKGVYVVQAAGNTGPGVSTVTSWSPWITSVAASTTDRSYPNFLYLGNNVNLTGLGFAPPTPGASPYPMVRASDAPSGTGFVNPDFDCQDPTTISENVVTGKILICTFDGIPSVSGSLSNLSRNAAELSGAVGVILLMNYDISNNQSPSTLLFTNYPGIVIYGLQAVATFMQYYQASTLKSSTGMISNYGATAKFSGGNQAVYTGLPPLVASFSSRGPDLNTGIDGAPSTDYPVADVLKPNVLAPGVDIWSAWTPLPGTLRPLFVGQKWSMISGTSMATPHFAGVAALVKENHRDWTPAVIASALLTTAIPSDSLGNALVAYDYSLDEYGQPTTLITRPGNAFDYGSGFVNAYAALDPGLVFNATYEDYINFMCSTGLISSSQVLAIAAQSCPALPGLPSDLNLPSITIGTLKGTRSVPRLVTSVSLVLEVYTVDVTTFKPLGVDVTVLPTTFSIARGGMQRLDIVLKALVNSTYVNETSFGKIYLIGNLGHRVQIPLSVTYKTV